MEKVTRPIKLNKIEIGHAILEEEKEGHLYDFWEKKKFKIIEIELYPEFKKLLKEDSPKP